MFEIIRNLKNKINLLLVSFKQLELCNNIAGYDFSITNFHFQGCIVAIITKHILFFFCIVSRAIAKKESVWGFLTCLKKNKPKFH